jgi:hypothetical protein
VDTKEYKYMAGPCVTGIIDVKEYVLEVGTRNRAVCRRITSSAANGRCAIACLAGEPMLAQLDNASYFCRSPRTGLALTLQYVSQYTEIV